ncbi:MAG TPA: hypothetical protein VFZ34_03760 [Blastocatellia bacterium]|nr:hypothetical protein [Blastocatellia bacterium]
MPNRILAPVIKTREKFMIRTGLVITVIALSVMSASAQEKTATSTRSSADAIAGTRVQRTDQTTELAAGTQLSAELLSTIDASKAKPGDEVKLRLIKPVMEGQKRLFNKGTILLGHITEATKAEGKQGVSQVRVVFNEIRNKDVSLPFSATLEQITKANLQGDLGDDAMLRSSSSASSSSRASAQSNAGLLGGVTGTVGNTVGGVVGGVTDTTSQTVSSVAGTTRQGVGQVLAVSSNTVNTATGKASGLILISSETNAQTESSSMLSLTGRNMKIEKGALFLLRTDKSLAVTANR